MRRFLRIFIALTSIASIKAGLLPSFKCYKETREWSTWTDCPRTCPGGTQTRTRDFRCKTVSWTCDRNRKCKNKPKDFEEFDSRQCEPTCANGGTYDSVTSNCLCLPKYWHNCCDKVCTNPDHCESQYCNSPSDPEPRSVCLQCENTKSDWNVCGHLDPYKPCSACRNIDDVPGQGDAFCNRNGICEPRCNWLGHECWPGTCDKGQYLASSCKCIDGFKKSTNSLSTKCILTNEPDILTCNIGAISQQNEIARNTFADMSTHCDDALDTFINFDPEKFSFSYALKFTLPVDPPKDDKKHKYIEEFSFGIIHAGVELRMHKRNGKIVSLGGNRDIKSTCNYDTFSKDNPSAHLLECTSEYIFNDNGLVRDAEKICHKFKAIGSGFLKVNDLYNNRMLSQKQFYNEVTTYREICFMTDFTRPVHCITSAQPCKMDVLQFGNRVRNTFQLRVESKGWFDPDIESISVEPSGISLYELYIYNMEYGGGELFANTLDAVDNQTSTSGNFDIDLPYHGQAHMFALYLYVLDSTKESPNYRVARRMILVDNVSTIAVNASKAIVVTSATNLSNVNWQTNLQPIKLDWTGHFYNTNHTTLDLLLPIRGANASVMESNYDQTTGELPIRGTPNVHGIVNFKYSFTRTTNDIIISRFADVPHFETQNLKISELAIQDGDNVYIDIKVRDIMNNTYTERVTVKIDSSPPVLENLGLFKDHYKYLYVHNRTDLAHMDMRFDTYDVHSGMLQILWSLGHAPRARDIGSGSIPVDRINGTCPSDETCYCPILGDCQIFHYGIDLNPLIANNTHVGSHNRDYYFWIMVTNEAGLDTEDEYQILVDDSPPEFGVVLDGPVGSKSRDFQSTPLISWNWHGFIDHESGISKYHIAAGNRCFSKEELQFLYNLEAETKGTEWFYKAETTFEFSSYEVEVEGFYRLSVLALNNAMEPSEVACSTGVIYDTTPPIISHVDLIGVRGQPSIACSDQNDLYYISPERRIQQLSYTDHCTHNLCDQSYDLRLYIVDKLRNGSQLPQMDDEQSDYICKFLPFPDTFENLFLPSDNLWLTWNVTEPESQVLDAYIGLSSSKDNTESPDIIGYQSTHNRTHYKCIHCGLGEGDIFHIMLKVTNKAGLSTIDAFGPIVIDMTPPEYQGGIAVSLSENDVNVTWNRDTFFDNEDSEFIAEYYFALGVKDNLEEVVTWQRVGIHQRSEILPTMGFTFPIQLLQQHDQDLGLQYSFSIKAVNRAGLFHIETLEPFTIHSKVMPSCGLLWHVQDVENRTEIGLVSSRNKLCVAWDRCKHDDNNVRYSLSLGTTVGSSNTVSKIDVNVAENELPSWCFENLNLNWKIQYYATLLACNTMGCGKVTSKGVMVAQDVHLIQSGIAVLGDGCVGEFRHRIAVDVTIDARAFETSFTTILTAVSDYTLRLGFDSPISRDSITVNIDGSERDLSYWTNDGTVKLLYYSFSLLNATINIKIESTTPVTLAHIDLHPCNANAKSQSATKVLTARWSFEPWIHSYVADYTIQLYERFCTSATCEPPVLVEVDSAGKSGLYHFVDVSLRAGHKYHFEVSPCFGKSCVTALTSNGVLIDQNVPLSQYLKATINTIGLNETRFHLTAEWETFISSVTAISEYNVLVYDWAVALMPTGGSLLTNWKRVKTDAASDIIAIDTLLDLPVHSRRHLYLAIRPHPSNHLTSIEYLKIKIVDDINLKNIEVFDLPADFDLSSIEPYLHSVHGEYIYNELHNSDINFSNDLANIKGAALGRELTVSPFYVQSDASVNCVKNPSNMHCIHQKESVDNTIEFLYQTFNYGVTYYICGYMIQEAPFGEYSALQACSNGFMIDTEAPLPGYVIAGTTDASIQSDNTVFYVEWHGFSDLEEETKIPYVLGLQEYLVALGTTSNGDDISKYESVGLSTHKVYTGLNLKSGRMHYATVRACDHVDQCTTVSSNGVFIDSSPPLAGHVATKFIHSQLSKQSRDDLLVHYHGFVDDESEMASYELGIGSTVHGQDVKQFGTVEGGMVSIDGKAYSMVDGHSYFIQVKGINRVGLWVIAASEPFIYDSSPPVAGYVRWGSKEDQVPLKYTTEVNHISGHWGGYTDPHTSVTFYRYAVGSAPGRADLLPWQDVGLNTGFSIEFHLDPGLPYYLTVEACNGIYLCTRDSSSGPLIADKTPPLPGTVHVGMRQEHEKYQSNRHSISIRWFDFYDPESDIRRYKWCVGTSETTCDIIPQQNAHMSQLAIKTGIELPLGVPLYATVQAINNAELFCKATSTSFYIDTSAPEIMLPPTAVGKLGLTHSTRYDRSFISYEWKFEEDTTPIENHVISLSAHDDGIILLNEIVVGDVKTYTSAFDEDGQLSDGTLYTFKVVSCNAASLCNSATNDFLLDSSPPHLGGFKEPMHWRHESGSTIFNLLWTGFADPHSEIALYKLMIGTTYSGHELSKGIIEIAHDDSGSDQNVEITVNEIVQPDTKIFLSIWATNGAGLLSDTGKTSMFLLESGQSGGNKHGRLDIGKHSCESHYCTGDCTCAALGRICTIKHNDTCQELTNYTSDPIIKVFINNTIYKGDQIPSTACVAAHWTWEADPDYLDHVKRFEWSISAKDAAPGVPIFNIIEDKHWFDVELQTNTVFCIPPTKQQLEHTYEYVFHLRAWHNFTFYTYTQSESIFIDTSPPVINHGKSVRNMDKFFGYIITFTTSTNELYADWDKVFSDKESGIHHYEVSLGHSVGGNEVFGPENLGLLTRISISNLTLTPGFTYYTTVHAYNPLGMLVSMTSDGLTVDAEPPFPGVVHTSGEYQDQMYHSSDIIFTWQGFFDKHSYINQYVYHLSTADNLNGSLVEFTTNGIKTELKIDKENLDEGVEYYLHVKAQDAAGFESDVVTSMPVVIDKIPPIMLPCSEYQTTNASSSACNCNIHTHARSNQTCLCTLDTLQLDSMTAYELELEFEDPDPELEGRVQINSFSDWLYLNRVGENRYKHSSKFVSSGSGHVNETLVLHIFRGNIGGVLVTLNQCSSSQVDPIETGVHVRQIGPNEVNFNWLVGDDVSGIKRFQLGVGTTMNGYQLMPLTDVGRINSLTISTQLLHQMQIEAILIAENNAGLVEYFRTNSYTVDWTAPEIRDITVEVKRSVDFNYSYVANASWNVVESESLLNDCLWSAGSRISKTDFLTTTPTDTLYSSTVTIPDVEEGDDVYVNIRCYNNIGLYSETYYMTRAVSTAPRSDEAYISFIPQMKTHYKPQASRYQSSGLKQLQFTFHGFDDVNITRYSYQIEGNGFTPNWNYIGLVDTMLLTSDGFVGESLYTFKVRATNSAGFSSHYIQREVYLTQSAPTVTGSNIQHSIAQDKLIIDWSNLFTWDNTMGTLLYEIQAGPVERSSLYLNTKTFDSNVKLLVHTLESGRMYLVITAVAPSGEFVRYNGVIYFQI